MRISHRKLRTLVESIILESFKDDQRYLIEKHPEHAQDLSRLQPKWIAWLAARFGERPRVKETHPFEDAIVTVLNFSKRDASLSAKYAAPGTEEKPNAFKASVDEAFPPKSRSWTSPADAMTMTVDEMELILGLSERKTERFKSEVSEEEMESDRVGKVGPWNLWMPTTRERSCRIAGYDPVTRKPRTTWCTARMAGSNLFYNYVGRPGADMTLFYVIRDDPAGDEDWLSVGFVNGRPQLDGRRGSVSVDRANDGLTPNRLSSILGPHHDEIMAALTAKNRALGGQHPARQKIKDAAQSPAALRYLVTGLSKDEAADLKRLVLDEPEVDPSVLSALAADASSEVRLSVTRNPNTTPETLRALAADAESYIRRYVAENPNTTPETLRALAADSVGHVRWHVANNPNTPPETLRALAADADGNVREYVASNLSTPSEVLRALAADISEGIRAYVASNPSVPPEILRALAADVSNRVRAHVAENPSAPPEILHTLAADAESYVRWHVAKNPNTPPEILRALAADADGNVRGYVTRNPSTPPEVLADLGRDRDKTIRLLATSNVNTPIATLQKLAKDRSSTVRDSAKRALARRQTKLDESQLRRLIRHML